MLTSGHVRTARSGSHAGRRSTLNSELSTLNSSGTVLVLVVALLAMLALMATTFLVTSRYDQIGTRGAMISHQMEMLLSMLESDVRRKLAEDLWGDDEGHNNPGNDAHEAYDGPDDAHAWITGICGHLITWEPVSGNASYTQAVVEDEANWKTLPGTDVNGLQFRYAVLIQGLGGLINVNVARQPDPDLVGDGYPVSPDVDHPENWPYTIWAFHAERNNADWGYWWWTGDKRYKWTTPVDFFAGFGETFRGGGPAQHVDLRYLLADRGELGRIDSYFRKYENLGREFDIQDELDLRFPGLTLGGAPYPSMVEEALPSLFSSATPNGIPAHRRRLVTAIARTTGWQRRREPIRMHPYDDAFWSQPGLDKSLCEEAWYFRFDAPHYDDLIKYLAEARMGFRISLQRGVTLSRMWPDDPFDIYKRMNPTWYGSNAYPPISPVSDVPKAAPPFMYDDWLCDTAKRNWPPNTGDYVYYQAPNLVVLLLANTMALTGVPSPDKNPDDAASYAPAGYAHTAAGKTARVKDYRKLVGTMHLNLEDYQDPNNVPGMLRPQVYDTSYRVMHRIRLNRYGGRAGAEDRPYITEVVMEFEIWPDYALIWEKNYYGRMSLEVFRVDKGSGADKNGAGLKADDQLTHVRTAGSSTWHPVNTLAALRSRLRPLTPPGTIDVKVNRSGATVEITAVPVDVAVRTIAVEIYNPHDRQIMVQDDSLYDSPRFRYNICVPQQCEYATGKRAFLCHYPPNYIPVRNLAARGCMLYVEFRGVSTSTGNSLMTSYGLAGISHYQSWGHRYRYTVIPGEKGNLVNLREDGELLMTINGLAGGFRGFGYLADAVRNEPTFPDAPPTPATATVLPPPSGIKRAFAEARTRINAGKPNPVVRLYRPLYTESRATQYMTASDSWISGGTRTPAASRLGKRDSDEDDFPRTLDADYLSIDARGFPVAATNKGFRFGADLSRVTRLTQPMFVNTYGSRNDSQFLWLEYDGAEGDAGRAAPTEIIDRRMRETLARIGALGGDKTLASKAVRQIIQKAEARLRFSPYTPTTDAERAECKAMYDFVDAFTVGGAAYDNLDNNGNAFADEHGAQRFNLGMPPELEENDPGGQWLKEHSNCWPAYGRINVNTAPREILENCLIAPTDAVRRQLGTAIWNERGGEAGQGNAAYKPFKSLGELYGRVSVLNGYVHGFDHYGFDGVDNHSGANKLPDMPPEPYTYVDDLEERNYLWRINSEVITLRTDTFAAYLRFQARRNVNGKWKMVAERRIYSVWDRATCLWPAHRHDGRLHTDFVAPQRVGIQVFGY